MGLADDLSKNSVNMEALNINLHGEKVKKGKWNKNVKEYIDKQFWESKNGELLEIPEIHNRKRILEEAHEEVGHKSTESVYHKIKNRYYWPVIKNSIKNMIKKCQACIVNNRKNKRIKRFVETKRVLEALGLDTVKIGSKNILIGIDYFTRLGFATILKNKKGDTIVNCLQEWCENGNYPEKIITDKGTEFENKYFQEFCVDNNIVHFLGSVDNHYSRVG